MISKACGEIAVKQRRQHDRQIIEEPSLIAVRPTPDELVDAWMIDASEGGIAVLIESGQMPLERGLVVQVDVRRARGRMACITNTTPYDGDFLRVGLQWM